MNIYVSNLSFHTGESELKELFSKFGTVTSVKVILDRETRQPRGFAFLEMPSDDEGNKAMAALNNKEIEGRPLSVAIAREKANSSARRNSFSH
jgi:RNA recognition motif-containing protein